VDANTEIGPTFDVAIRKPYRVREPEIEMCAWCGRHTIVGIYTRVDPSTVPYPSTDDDDAKCCQCMGAEVASIGCECDCHTIITEDHHDDE
jgi:hypothetical protein